MAAKCYSITLTLAHIAAPSADVAIRIAKDANHLFEITDLKVEGHCHLIKLLLLRAEHEIAGQRLASTTAAEVDNGFERTSPAVTNDDGSLLVVSTLPAQIRFDQFDTAGQGFIEGDWLAYVAACLTFPMDHSMGSFPPSLPTISFSGQGIRHVAEWVWSSFHGHVASEEELATLSDKLLAQMAAAGVNQCDYFPYMIVRFPVVIIARIRFCKLPRLLSGPTCIAVEYSTVK